MKIMKALFLSFIALLSISFLSAQTTIKPGIGMNFTDFSENPAGTELKAKVGYQIGGSVAFGKKFYIEPGLFYVGKSTEFSSTNTSFPGEEDLQISGLRIPVAVGLNILGNEKTTISLRGFGGLSGFFVTNVSDDVDEDEIEKTNFGVFAGAGLDFWKLYLDLSYEWSLTNVQKDVSAIDFGKSRSLYITAGLRINL
jgi:Outer membrane protein beta-barrel domain